MRWPSMPGSPSTPARYNFTRSQAFDLLRVASQHTNRKLAEIATEVGDTGTLDLPGRTAAARRQDRTSSQPRQPSP